MSKTIVRKFKFADLALAHKVRQNMWSCLVKFDKNYNMKFESSQITQFLVAILGESESQVQYVVNNVFRYDKDGDGSITYPQFTNFCVEQHFGEMAIQRLHRKQFYVNGSKRIMNLQEFQTTLNYCLQRIASKGTHSQYYRLFSEVDLDKDGFISYQDYFIFLRQYFGSQSQAFQEQEKNPRPLPPKPASKPEPIKYSIKQPQQKLARLIYTQFKISVMERNSKQNLLLQKSELEQILMNILKLNYEQSLKIRTKCLAGQSCTNYENFMKIALVTYMSEAIIKSINKQRLSLNQFVELIGRGCGFVAVKPSQQLLRACFYQITKGSQILICAQLTNSLRNTFQNYRFDNRGIPSFVKQINISYV